MSQTEVLRNWFLIEILGDSVNWILLRIKEFERFALFWTSNACKQLGFSEKLQTFIFLQVFPRNLSIEIEIPKDCWTRSFTRLFSLHGRPCSKISVQLQSTSSTTKVLAAFHIQENPLNHSLHETPPHVTFHSTSSSLHCTNRFHISQKRFKNKFSRLSRLPNGKLSSSRIIFYSLAISFLLQLLSRMLRRFERVTFTRENFLWKKNFPCKEIFRGFPSL